MGSERHHGRSAALLGLTAVLAAGAPLACRSKSAITPADAERQPGPAVVAKAAGAEGANGHVPVAHRSAGGSEGGGELATAASRSDSQAPQPGPFGELPAVPHGILSGRVVGYSGDDRHLGYAISTCDQCPLEFHFFPLTGPALSMSYRSPSEGLDEHRRRSHDQDVDRKLEALGADPFTDVPVLRGPFPADLVFAVKTTRDDDKGTVTLHFGARLPGAAPVYPMKVVLGPHGLFEPPKQERERMATLPPAEREKELRAWRANLQVFDPALAYANVTKDGKEIGIVAHALGTSWWETAGIARMQTDAFVAQVRAASRVDAGE